MAVPEKSRRSRIVITPVLGGEWADVAAEGLANLLFEGGSAEELLDKVPSGIDHVVRKQNVVGIVLHKQHIDARSDLFEGRDEFGGRASWVFATGDG
mgnify:FL=1